MTTVAGGMESDSDSECDMVFSSTVSNTKNKKNSNFSSKNFHNENHPKASSKFDNSPDISREVRGEKPHENNIMIPNQVMRKKYSNSLHSRQRAHRNKTLVFDDLRYAISQGNLATTKNLYESNDVHIDTILKSGWTGLMYACSMGHADIVQYLLERGSDPNFHHDMFTPLMAVCISKKDDENLLRCCSLLLQYKANVNVHERHHNTPLIFAARENHKDIVRLLLQHGADADAADSRGYTALAWAALYGHGQVVRVLLENGADRNKVNNMGQLPADIAYDHGHTEVASILQKLHTLTEEDSISTLTASLPDDSKKVSFDSKVNSNSDNSKKFVKLGELHLFLIGIGCQDLVDKFIEHHLTFHDLLLMDDEDLEKIGVFQVGLRKKILEACKAVHKKEWQNSSLPNLKRNNYISCPDAVSMVANISKHLKYISTSVIYIRNQIESQPRILELSKDGANIHNLMDEVEDSLKNLYCLKDEMRFLKMHLEKVQEKPEYACTDSIENTTAKKCSNRKLVFAIGITTVSIVLAAIWWKNPDAIQPSIFIRIPFLKQSS